jgi:hypothetical protein
MDTDRVFFDMGATPSQTRWLSSVKNALFLTGIFACLIGMLFLGTVLLIARSTLSLTSRMTGKHWTWRQREQEWLELARMSQAELDDITDRCEEDGAAGLKPPRTVRVRSMADLDGALA